MKIIAIVFIIGGACFLSSCREDSISPPPATGFSVRISVKDLGGNPAAGLRISAWNHLSISIGKANIGSIHQSTSILSTSTIGFNVATSAKINFSVLEFDGTPISTLVDRVLPAGSHIVAWQIQRQQPTRVYRYRLVAQDTSNGGILFRDSLYAVLWQPDTEISILGWTSQAGTYETNDRLLFPNVLDLPPLIHTTSSGPDSIGTFTIRDTVTIVLTDTTTHRQTTFLRTISKGITNDIQLVWNPTLSKEWFPSTRLKEELQGTTRTGQRTSDLIEWKLHQNYPNPFN